MIDDEISIANKRLMRETLKEYDAMLHFLTIDKKYFSDAVESERIPETAYYRIAIPELFSDQNLERILYLDCDMIALGDISELWEIDLSDYTLVAVEDAGFHHRLEKMDIACSSTKYFNSGFMLINMNAILHDQWLQLHPKWNAQSYIMKREVEHPDPEGEKEYFETRRDPKIIHYSGHVKPWSPEFTSSLKKYYEEYEELTAFTDEEELSAAKASSTRKLG